MDDAGRERGGIVRETQGVVGQMDGQFGIMMCCLTYLGEVA